MRVRSGEEFLQHRLPGDDGLPEVTLDDVGQIAEVLLPSRLVETELMHQLGMAFRGYAALAGQESHRIARQQPDKGEGHQGDAEEGRYELGQPGDDEAEHGTGAWAGSRAEGRSEEHTSELQSLMRISYAVFCLKKKNKTCRGV